MKCVDCDGYCSCHVSPPCWHCVVHAECVACGGLTCNEPNEKGLTLCQDCEFEMKEVSE